MTLRQPVQRSAQELQRSALEGQQLSRELNETNPPPLGSLVADALADASKLRARRRRGYTAGSGLAVATILETALTITGPAGPQRAGSPGAPSASASNPQKTGVTQRPIAGGDALALLEQLLPPGGHISETSTENPGPAPVAASLLYDDGHGSATVMAGIGYGTGLTGPGPTHMQCHTASSVPGYACTYSVLPGGVELRVETMGPYTTGCTTPKCSIKDLRVTIRRPDGVYVTAETFNGPFGGGAQQREPTPYSTPNN